MRVLAANVDYFEFLGLYLPRGQNHVTTANILLNIAVTLPVFLILTWSWCYLFVHVTEILKMTFALYVVSAVTIYFSSYWTFAVRKSEFRRIVDELQRIVASSESNIFPEKIDFS